MRTCTKQRCTPASLRVVLPPSQARSLKPTGYAEDKDAAPCAPCFPWVVERAGAHKASSTRQAASADQTRAGVLRVQPAASGQEQRGQREQLLPQYCATQLAARQPDWFHGRLPVQLRQHNGVHGLSGPAGAQSPKFKARPKTVALRRARSASAQAKLERARSMIGPYDRVSLDIAVRFSAKQRACVMQLAQLSCMFVHTGRPLWTHAADAGASEPRAERQQAGSMSA